MSKGKKDLIYHIYSLSLLKSTLNDISQLFYFHNITFLKQDIQYIQTLKLIDGYHSEYCKTRNLSYERTIHFDIMLILKPKETFDIWSKSSRKMSNTPCKQVWLELINYFWRWPQAISNCCDGFQLDKMANLKKPLEEVRPSPFNIFLFATPLASH